MLSQGGDVAHALPRFVKTTKEGGIILVPEMDFAYAQDLAIFPPLRFPHLFHRRTTFGTGSLLRFFLIPLFFPLLFFPLLPPIFLSLFLTCFRAVTKQIFLLPFVIAIVNILDWSTFWGITYINMFLQARGTRWTVKKPLIQTLKQESL